MEGKSRKEQEVWEACDLLHKRRETLTYKNIFDALERLGYPRGSTEQINKYLQSWRNNIKEKAAEQLDPNDDLVNAIETIKEKLKRQVLFEAEAEAEADKAALKQQVINHERQVQEAQSKLLEKEQEVLGLHAQIEQISRENSLLKKSPQPGPIPITEPPEYSSNINLENDIEDLYREIHIKSKRIEQLETENRRITRALIETKSKVKMILGNISSETTLQDT